jgi:hypothetical protein
MMNKYMGILLFLLTLLGIGGIYFHYKSSPTKAVAPIVMYRVEPTGPAAPSNSDKSMPQAMEDFRSYSPTVPTTIPTPTTNKTMGGGLDIETQKFYVKAAFSGLVLIASLFIVFKGGSADAAKWAFGSVGTILGYWLK